MTTMLIRLEAPLQSWGDSSRFVQRKTRTEPTKSGIIGLLAAAQGRRRSDPVEDLVGLRFGVRTDQAGTLTKDFQTAIDWRTRKSMPLSHRYYLADARFLAAIEGPDDLIGGLAHSLRHPTFPLYLGRRSCPPAGPLHLTMTDAAFVDALKSAPWCASPRHQKKQAAQVLLPIARDALPGEDSHETVRDIPTSFDPNDRRYAWRDVVHDYTNIDNACSEGGRLDWLAPLGGS